jgi:hypothetical protein
MSNLVGVIAGGMYEAKRFLGVQIKRNLHRAQHWFGLGMLFWSIPITFYLCKLLISLTMTKKDDKNKK